MLLIKNAPALRALVGMLITGSVIAGTTTEPVVEPTKRIPAWVPSIQAGYLHQFDTDLDPGGSFSADRATLRVGISRAFARDRTIGLSLGYGFDGYNFNGVAPEPWSEIHTLRLGLPIRWSVGDKWTLFGIPTVRSTAESGASFSDGVTGGFIGGASYAVNDRLSIGPGFGALSQLEDSASVFPVIVINWKITEDLSLETGRGFGASQGPGLVLNWQLSDRWQLSLGSRYERLRFRLDDRGPAPDGVGEEKGIPVYLGASYSLSRFSTLSIYAGAKLGGSLSVDNQFGTRLTKTDFDTAPFAGMSWKLGF